MNLLAVVLSLAAIGVALYLNVHAVAASSTCQKSLKMRVFTGGALLGLSLFRILASCFRFNHFMWLYLFLIISIAIGLVGFSVFASEVTKEVARKVVPSQGHKEYRLRDHSNWLRNHLEPRKRSDQYSAAEFYRKNLTPLQSGCCKPLSDCVFEFGNANLLDGAAHGTKASR
ncbi:hypothetical protein CDL15_Pgr008764 [Punica granatum]|nr:hypothetical protein CDL15_Pgr008764 [Punica granatum]